MSVATVKVVISLQHVQNPAMSKAAQGIGDSNYKSQQDLLKTKYPKMDPTFSSGGGPQTPQDATPAGVFPSPEASPLPSPHPREIPLSAVSCISNPNFEEPADPQKLAASWVFNQHYGDAADQVSVTQASVTCPVLRCQLAANFAHKAAPSQATFFLGCIVSYLQMHARHCACLAARAAAMAALCVVDCLLSFSQPPKLR